MRQMCGILFVDVTKRPEYLDVDFRIYDSETKSKNHKNLYLKIKYCGKNSIRKKLKQTSENCVRAFCNFGDKTVGGSAAQIGLLSAFITSAISFIAKLKNVEC